jgi:hypothetical protein
MASAPAVLKRPRYLSLPEQRDETLRSADAGLNSYPTANGTEKASLSDSLDDEPTSESLLLRLLLAVPVNENIRSKAYNSFIERDAQVFPMGSAFKITFTLRKDLAGDIPLRKLVNEFTEVAFNRLGERVPVHVFYEPHADGTLHVEGLIRVPERLPRSFLRGAEALGLDRPQSLVRLADVLRHDWLRIAGIPWANRKHSARVSVLRAHEGIRYAVKGIKGDYEQDLLGEWPPWVAAPRPRSPRQSSTPRIVREGKYRVVSSSNVGRPPEQRGTAEFVLGWIQREGLIERHAEVAALCIAARLFGDSTWKKVKTAAGITADRSSAKRALRGRFARGSWRLALDKSIEEAAS